MKVPFTPISHEASLVIDLDLNPHKHYSVTDLTVQCEIIVICHVSKHLPALLFIQFSFQIFGHH